jgi:hypothetical protein
VVDIFRQRLKKFFPQVKFCPEMNSIVLRRPVVADNFTPVLRFRGLATWNLLLAGSDASLLVPNPTVAHP